MPTYSRSLVQTCVIYFVSCFFVCLSVYPIYLFDVLSMFLSCVSVAYPNMLETGARGVRGLLGFVGFYLEGRASCYEAKGPTFLKSLLVDYKWIFLVCYDRCASSISQF